MPRVAKKVKALTTQAAEERLRYLKLRNRKLSHELRQRKEQLEREYVKKSVVIRSAHVVKTLLFTLPARVAPLYANMAEAWEIDQHLRSEIEQACNDLADLFGATIDTTHDDTTHDPETPETTEDD